MGEDVDGGVGVSEAERITAGSGSNLALALWVLPEAIRKDMRVFYAFCRVVDDLADEPGRSLSDRVEGLRFWRESVEFGRLAGREGSLPAELREVLAKHEIPPEWVCEIVRGCEMDLEGTRYRSWEDLKRYCFRVASAVGLVSAKIFGAEGCERYAEDLGLALQLTNILRDSAEDWRNGERVYFPLDELEACGVGVGTWSQGEPSGWRELMTMQRERAEFYFDSAAAALPGSQRRAMVAAEIMGGIYRRILREMRADGFRVWRRRYALGVGRKMWLAASIYARTWLG